MTWSRISCTYKLTSCSPALMRPSPMIWGVLFPDPPAALSGPGGEWTYSVPEPGVSAAQPDGYMGTYSWYSKFLNFSSSVLMVLSTNPTRARPSPSDSLGAWWCCEVAGLWGSDGGLALPTDANGCCSMMPWVSCMRGGVTGEERWALTPASSANGMTSGQQGTSSALDTAQARSKACWAAWIGVIGPLADCTGRVAGSGTRDNGSMVVRDSGLNPWASLPPDWGAVA